MNEEKQPLNSFLRIVGCIFIALVFVGCKSLDSATNTKESDNAFKRTEFLVFVGKKIGVKPHGAEDPCGIMNSGHWARFRVMQSLHGDPKKLFIRFTACDHYGDPPIKYYENILLFISKAAGRYYLEKYQSIPMFLSKNGFWVGCGTLGHDEEEVSKLNQKVDPHIRFGPDAYFDLSGYESVEEATERFDSEHFQVDWKNRRAICRKGNYARTFVDAKRRGSLKEVKLFQ